QRLLDRHARHVVDAVAGKLCAADAALTGRSVVRGPGILPVLSFTRSGLGVLATQITRTRAPARIGRARVPIVGVNTHGERRRFEAHAAAGGAGLLAHVLGELVLHPLAVGVL